MAVKFVHILKRIEAINRDINELHEMMGTMPQDRQYSDAVKIALEAQVNNLLNERVKLMELKIENPPPSFTEEQKESHLQKLKKSPRYDFEQFTISSKEPSTMPGRSFSFQDTSAKDKRQPERSARAVSPAVKSSTPTATMARSDILKDLPPLEY